MVAQLALLQQLLWEFCEGLRGGSTASHVDSAVLKPRGCPCSAGASAQELEAPIWVLRACCCSCCCWACCCSGWANEVQVRNHCSCFVSETTHWGPASVDTCRSAAVVLSVPVHAMFSVEVKAAIILISPGRFRFRGPDQRGAEQVGMCLAYRLVKVTSLCLSSQTRPRPRCCT